jgi:hypothetical protein
VRATKEGESRIDDIVAREGVFMSYSSVLAPALQWEETETYRGKKLILVIVVVMMMVVVMVFRRSQRIIVRSLPSVPDITDF